MNAPTDTPDIKNAEADLMRADANLTAARGPLEAARTTYATALRQYETTVMHLHDLMFAAVGETNAGISRPEVP